MSRCKIILAVVGFVAIIGWSAAQAGGSIGISEVMEQLKDNGALIAELETELKKQHLEAKKVVCIGSRFGHHWTHLGGARSVPFECEIGARKIEIDGELQLYDKNGKQLDFEGADTPEKAVSYKATKLQWTWN
jgi:hypothetical protein